LIINRALEKLKDPDLPPYQPSPRHWEIHRSPAKEILIGGGERGGKSRSVAQELVGRLTVGKPERFWLVGAKYENTHVEFRSTITLLQCLGVLPWEARKLREFVRMARDRAWEVKLPGDFDGTEIVTRSADEVTNIASWSLDGVVMCEAALLAEEAYRRLQGRVAERDGWILLSGTFEKTVGPWYARKFLEWTRHELEHHQQVFSLPTYENKVLFPEGSGDKKYQLMVADSSPERVAERYEGRPVPPSTIVFPQFSKDTHVGDHPFVPQEPANEVRKPVYLAIDPGWANYAILALQRYVHEDGSARIHIIDEVYGHNQTRGELIQRCRMRSWWKNLSSMGHVCDVAGNQRHGGDARSEIRAWYDVTGLRLNSRKVSIEQGIDRVASFLTLLVPTGEMEPRLFIDRRCRELLNEFELYQYADNKALAEVRVPEDKYNHGIKALGYFLVMTYGHSGRRRSRVANLELRVA
jgi:hypothetical protein